MNSMQRKIRQLFEQRSRFLAAVSHDMRTPITRMRLRAELIDDDELRTRMERDLAEMERMVQETLEFMRDGDSRETLRKVDLNALLDALVEDIAEQGRTVVFEPIGRPVIESRPLALKRCVGNLLSNALRHGVEVQLRVIPCSRGIAIEVLDNGPGIPQAELERVFEPFYRLDKSRGDTGTGLGLSIAKVIAESLGGSLTLENRDSGGLVGRIELPGVVV
jgi:signal transduction histidine kinase